jgi:endonuclease YncB( thermonuclease family)
MQEFCIKTHVTSYNNLATLKSGILSSDEQGMLGGCMSDWKTDNGFNWQMVEFCYENQHGSYTRLRQSEAPAVVQPPPASHESPSTSRKQRAGNPGSIVGRAIVVDGDTFELSGERVRLRGIDAAELSQECEDSRDFRYACGKVAAEALKALVADNEIRCDFAEWDTHGRFVGNCFLQDRNLAAFMVEQGHALDWSESSAGDYRKQQFGAESERRGMWAGKFAFPWAWRAKRGREEQSVDARPFGLFSDPN